MEKVPGVAWGSGRSQSERKRKGLLSSSPVPLPKAQGMEAQPKGGGSKVQGLIWKPEPEERWQSGSALGRT